MYNVKPTLISCPSFVKVGWATIKLVKGSDHKWSWLWWSAKFPVIQQPIHGILDKQNVDKTQQKASSSSTNVYYGTFKQWQHLILFQLPVLYRYHHHRDSRVSDSCTQWDVLSVVQGSLCLREILPLRSLFVKIDSLIWIGKIFQSTRKTARVCCSASPCILIFITRLFRLLLNYSMHNSACWFWLFV